MPNASRHFTMTPDIYGGVRLRLRHKFRDEGHDITEIDDDGVARARPDNEGNIPNNKGKGAGHTWDDLPQSTTPTNENGGDNIENIVHVFGPLLPGQTVRVDKQSNGTVAVVLVSPPDMVLGNSTINNSGTTKIDTTLNQGPTRDTYRAHTYRQNSESRKLASMNAVNKAAYKR